MPALPPIEPVPTGGTWHQPRRFNGAAVPRPVDDGDQPATTTPEPTPRQIEAMAEIQRILAESDDPAGLAARVLARIEAGEADEARCSAYPWCIETGDHWSHHSEPVTVSLNCPMPESHKHNHAESPYIETGLFSEDIAEGERGRVIVFFEDCDLDAASLRHEVAKIRATLPRIEALADMADGTAPVVRRSIGGCDRLNGQCERHEIDHGETIHRGPAYANDLADLTAFHLEQWGDDTPRIVSSAGGTWPDHNLTGFDAIIAAAEQQLAHARTVRAHLAAVLNEAPPTKPPEHQKVRPADGDAGEQVTE